MRKLKTIVIILVLLNLAATTWAVDLKYAGSTTIQLGFMYDAVKLYKEKTGKTISIMGGSSSAGVKGVLLGTINIGGASRVITKQEIQKGIYVYTVAWDAISVIVNKSNQIDNLTMAQLKDIHTGRIRNWREVGGPDKPITVVTSHIGSATKKEFNKIVMNKEPYLKNAVTVNSTRDEVGKVLENDSAIGAVSTSFADDNKIKVLKINGFLPIEKYIQSNDYKIARPLNIVTNGPAEGETKEFIDFMMSNEGQYIVSKKFIRIK